MPRVKPLANVWAAPCSKCGVGVNEYCRDLRGNNRMLFGRRTHKERAKAVRAMTSKPIGVNINTGTFVYNPEVWTRWNAAMSNTVTAISAATIQINSITADRVWTGWINTTTGTQTITGDVAWNHWNSLTPQVYRQAVTRLSPEDLAQRERERASRDALRRAQETERLERRLMAHSRALELLDMILTPDQREERIRDQRITVVAPSGRRYEVETHRETVHGNIVEVDAHGCRLRRGCVAPGMYGDDGALPTPDGWVGQVLALQHNEEELLAKTNWSHVQRCHQPDVPILGRVA